MSPNKSDMNPELKKNMYLWKNVMEDLPKRMESWQGNRGWSTFFVSSNRITLQNFS